MIFFVWVCGCWIFFVCFFWANLLTTCGHCSLQQCLCPSRSTWPGELLSRIPIPRTPPPTHCFSFWTWNGTFHVLKFFLFFSSVTAIISWRDELSKTAPEKWPRQGTEQLGPCLKNTDQSIKSKRRFLRFTGSFSHAAVANIKQQKTILNSRKVFYFSPVLLPQVVHSLQSTTRRPPHCLRYSNSTFVFNI